MIVVDTSALMAVLLDEPLRSECERALKGEERLLMSAGTLVEAYIAAEYRGVGPAMEGFIRFLGPAVVPATAETAVQALRAFRTWGKGRHPAKLNFGDCFAYALAKQLDCPLLFIGNDFSQTDIASVL